MPDKLIPNNEIPKFLRGPRKSAWNLAEKQILLEAKEKVPWYMVEFLMRPDLSAQKMKSFLYGFTKNLSVEQAEFLTKEKFSAAFIDDVIKNMEQGFDFTKSLLEANSPTPSFPDLNLADRLSVNNPWRSIDKKRNADVNFLKEHLPEMRAIKELEDEISYVNARMRNAKLEHNTEEYMYNNNYLHQLKTDLIYAYAMLPTTLKVLDVVPTSLKENVEKVEKSFRVKEVDYEGFTTIDEPGRIYSVTTNINQLEKKSPCLDQMMMSAKSRIVKNENKREHKKTMELNL